jgi:hypothetical protein
MCTLCVHYVLYTLELSNFCVFNINAITILLIIALIKKFHVTKFKLFSLKKKEKIKRLQKELKLQLSQEGSCERYVRA